MSALDPFLLRCEAVCRGLGIKRSTLSTRLFNDGKRLDQIACGGDIGVLRMAEVERLLAAEEAKVAEGAEAA